MGHASYHRFHINYKTKGEVENKLLDGNMSQPLPTVSVDMPPTSD